MFVCCENIGGEELLVRIAYMIKKCFVRDETTCLQRSKVSSLNVVMRNLHFCCACIFISLISVCIGANPSCAYDTKSTALFAPKTDATLSPKYRMIDLFAGIGGMRLGFELTGRGCCVFTSEWDAQCCKTYLANWPGAEIKGDIRKIEPQTIPDFDILCAGFPCQPFSTIGRREGFEHNTQGTLFFDNVAKSGMKNGGLANTIAPLEP